MAFSIKALKTLKQTGFRSTLIEAIKAANPSLNDLNFNDFYLRTNNASYDVLIVQDKVDSHSTGYRDGMTVNPIVSMSVLDDENIKRNYTERSYNTTFTINSPTIDELVKKHIQIENISELTWDDYNTVLNELNKFIGITGTSNIPVTVKETSESANSKYIHLCFNTNYRAGGSDDIPCALLSYKYESSKLDSNAVRLLSFHFTRAEVENKRDLGIENNTLTVGENGMVENHTDRTGSSNEL